MKLFQSLSQHHSSKSKLNFAGLLLLSLISLGTSSCAMMPVDRNQKVAPRAQTPQNQEAMPDLKKRIWILPFVAPDQVPEGVLGHRVSEKIYAKLLESFPSEKSPYLVQSVEDEEMFQSSGLNQMTDHKLVSKALKGSDIAGFLFGKITKIEIASNAKDSEGLLRKKQYSLKLTVSVELFDTAAGRKVSGTEFSQDYVETRSEVFGVNDHEGLQDPNDRVFQMVPQISEKIVNWAVGFAPKLSWYGRVLRIDGGRIYISAGRKTGLMVGDVLKVLESPKDIVDPQSGLMVGQAPGRMKGTVKVIQYFGADGALAVLQSGGNIFPDDRVELY